MADARGEYWYFDPDIDATKITVPELRSILLKHGVTYPSSAKKPVLIGLFYEQVAPQAATLQRAHARTKRSTRGIEDVSSSANSTTTDDIEDDTLLVPPPSTSRRTARRTARVSAADAYDAAVAPRGRTPTRSVPAKHDRGSEVDTEEPPAVRRNRRSVVTTSVKRSPPEPEQRHRQDDESPFTQDNPFQSGSSPPGSNTYARDRRRKTMGFEHREKRRSDANRRKTFQPNAEQRDNGIVVPSRHTFDVHDIHTKTETSAEPDSASAGEEFTSEEHLELIREREHTSLIDGIPARKRKELSRATATLKAFTLTFLATAAAVFGGAWRQEKYSVGFCGVGRDATSLAGVEVPEWLNILPQCEPCPAHARCYAELDIECDKNFVKQDHPLSLGGLIPLPPTCEPDSEKTRRITVVADKAVQILRKQRARFECGELDAEGNHVESPKVHEAEIKQQLLAQKRKGVTDIEFEEIFAEAIGEVMLREEVTDSSEGTIDGRQFASASLAELSLFCSVRRTLRESLERYLGQILVALLVLASGLYGRYSYARNRAMETRAKELARDVFSRLADHAVHSYQDPETCPDRGISMAQLRDDVLRDEFSTTRRKQLWDRVQKKVEFNSNVRAAVRTTQSGDVARVWEWIGNLQFADSSKRDSGRISIGPSHTQSMEVKELQTWDEGRPIY